MKGANVPGPWHWTKALSSHSLNITISELSPSGLEQLKDMYSIYQQNKLFKWNPYFTCFHR